MGKGDVVSAMCWSKEGAGQSVVPLLEFYSQKTQKAINIGMGWFHCEKAATTARFLNWCFINWLI